MKPLPISPLPFGPVGEESKDRWIEHDGFVDEAVVIAMTRTPLRIPLAAVPADQQLTDEDVDFAGWRSGPRPLTRVRDGHEEFPPSPPAEEPPPPTQAGFESGGELPVRVEMAPPKATMPPASPSPVEFSAAKIATQPTDFPSHPQVDSSGFSRPPEVAPETPWRRAAPPEMEEEPFPIPVEPGKPGLWLACLAGVITASAIALLLYQWLHG